jgi:hypothetical protein
MQPITRGVCVQSLHLSIVTLIYNLLIPFFLFIYILLYLHDCACVNGHCFGYLDRLTAFFFSKSHFFSPSQRLRTRVLIYFLSLLDGEFHIQIPLLCAPPPDAINTNLYLIVQAKIPVYDLFIMVVV